ncbi:MAG TPA: DUF4097 family beta strand repeat-containing protein [Longimicrobiales bacterium]|nr:DUF4097 family beta strand repeat-containing protein [Longimicrobiales bacterium]
MKRMFRTLVAVMALGVLGALPAAAQQDFQWRGRIPAGKSLEIKGVNGWIHVQRADGDMATVVASKRGRRDNPDDVKVEVVQHDGDVTICAVYPTPRRARRENECAPGDGGHMSVHDNDVKVEFTVQVPDGAEFIGRTVNGDVSVDGVKGNVEAHTVNGDVDVGTAGYAEAKTVNGSITATLGDSDLPHGLDFSTVNGSITVEMPEGLNADFSARTVNGHIETDFPITIQGRMSPRHLSGQIGKGGPELSFSTVNGSIRLRRR